MFSFTKQPWEETTRSVDTSGFAELQAGETIHNIVVTVFLGTIAQPTMLVSTTRVGNIIFFRIRGGLPGTNYKITVRVTTSANHQREVDIMCYVKEN